MGVSPRQTPEQLRAAIAEVLRQRLAQHSASTEGTLTQLRARWRLVELLNVAKERGIPIEGRSLTTVKAEVFESLRSELRTLGAPYRRGSVNALSRRIEDAKKRIERLQEAAKEPATKSIKK